MPLEPGPELSALLPSWELSLSERGLSPNTTYVYRRTVTAFTAYLAGHGLPSQAETVTPLEVRSFLATEAARTSPVSAHQHYRNLRVFFGWMEREGERQNPNPMHRVDPPKVARKVKPVLSAPQLAALLKQCEGTRLVDRRDMAVMRILIDSGARVSSVAGMRLADVDMTRKTIRVVLKGGDEHVIPLGRKAAAALDRYLRARARHRRADSEWLWLGTTGRDPAHFGTAGIQDMIERKGRAAGLGKVTPHFFRRTFAHSWLHSGGSELDGMRIAGWRSRRMIEAYAEDLAGDRAREAHARLSPGDKI